jgi:hypothetical protein
LEYTLQQRIGQAQLAIDKYEEELAEARLYLAELEQQQAKTIEYPKL